MVTVPWATLLTLLTALAMAVERDVTLVESGLKLEEMGF